MKSWLYVFLSSSLMKLAQLLSRQQTTFTYEKFDTFPATTCFHVSGSLFLHVSTFIAQSTFGSSAVLICCLLSQSLAPRPEPSKCLCWSRATAPASASRGSRRPAARTMASSWSTRWTPSAPLPLPLSSLGSLKSDDVSSSRGTEEKNADERKCGGVMWVFFT